MLQFRQDKALQNVARKKNRGNSCRIPRLSERDKNPQGLLLVAVGRAAASIKAGGGLSKDYQFHTKGKNNANVTDSNTINRETAGMKPRPSQCTATESDGEADAAMLWGGVKR